LEPGVKIRDTSCGETSRNHIEEANEMSYMVLLGRILFSLIFVKSSFGNFSAGAISYAAAQGVPLASIAVPVSGVMALLGGLSVALGYKPG
jgi:putative oxidoreductase